MEMVKTEDGSVSCRDIATGELFHNRAGAFTEALRNYVEPSQALRTLSEKKSLSVLDACFGLGYNTFVLLLEIVRSPVMAAQVNVVGLELDACVLKHLPAVLADGRFARLVATMKEIPSGFCSMELSMGDRPDLKICLNIRPGDLRLSVPQLTGDFDLVFHDPFSPSRVPELWSVDLFKEYFRLLSASGGKLLTYSSASAVRGGLEEAGFELYRTSAVGGKSGGTLACLSPAGGQPAGTFKLSQDETDRIKSRSGIPYRDTGFAGKRKDILKSRELEQASEKRD